MRWVNPQSSAPLPCGSFSSTKSFDRFNDKTAFGRVIICIDEIAVEHGSLMVEAIGPQAIGGVHHGPQQHQSSNGFMVLGHTNGKAFSDEPDEPIQHYR